jgi:hypothetical protein
MSEIYYDVDVALAEVPINASHLIDDSDFKTREESVTYDQAGLDLSWCFVTPAGAFTRTAVTPTDTAGDYDWVNQGNAYYTIEIPDSGGASINNDTEGTGWFEGFATGILPWRSPYFVFRAAGLNDALIESAWSATRGLAGTALPAVAADGAGGIPISDDGGLDLDAILERLPAALVAGRMSSDMVALSGDTAASDLLELFAEALNASGLIDSGTLDTDLDTYQSKTFLLDDDNGATDLYLTIWFRNGQPITSGITSPTIQVIKASDASDLVASGAQTEIGSLGLYKKAETSNRIVAGAGYIAKTQATIGGATQTWYEPVGRDS